MKKVLSLLAGVTLVVSMIVSPVCAAGGKVQNEHEQDIAAGPANGPADLDYEDGGPPGSDAQDNQAD